MRAHALTVYLTAADLCDRFRCSHMWITRHIKQHHFPKPVRLGGRRSARPRRLADVEAWEAQRTCIDEGVS
jgi:predicted DNA-binding transcriptional regulator AlpA